MKLQHKPLHPKTTRCYPLPSMIHLDLQPEIEAQLAAEAQSRGLAPDRYVAMIVESSLSQEEELQLERDLQQGLREIATGDTRPAREVFAELCEEYDLRG